MNSQLEKIFMKVQKPGRYTGGELNSIVKDLSKVDFRFAFCFPDLYEVGMSHLGMKILYSLYNREENMWCERVFAPDTDMEAMMREEGIPLFGLESRDPIRDFDMVGFTLQYEMSYTAVLNMLDLAGIPLRTAQRTSLAPMVIAGGPCTCNPEPLADFIDLKGLMGDSSDNISGVKGIGEKTALALISEYGSVEGLYEKLGKGEVTATKSVIAKLEAGAQDAKDSKWLATIVTDAPISRNIADYSYKEKDEAALSQLLTELEMTKLMEKLNIKPSAEAPSEAEKLSETEYTLSEMSVNDISGSFAFIFVTGEKPKLYV